jgi:AT-rich DNA-binding protein
MKEVNVSQATLRRLPQYLRVMREKEDISYISSTIIAEELKLNPVQVRKDLALISQSDGKPGLGFEIKELIKELEKFLGFHNRNDAIIVGAGRLGQALLSYHGFGENLNIVMAFDIDEKKVNHENVFSINKMKELVKERNIKIGIITVPKEQAQLVCDLLIDCGINAIWNFAPKNLKVPETIVIKNEDLTASILILLKQLDKKYEDQA